MAVGGLDILNRRPRQGDFKSEGAFWYRDAISHLPQIQEIISTHYAEEAYTDSLRIKIVLKRHGSVLQKGAYKVSGSNVEDGWKTLFQDLQAKLAERLKAEKSFCARPAGDCVYFLC